MKKQFQTARGFVRRISLLLAAATLIPAFAVGCMSAEEIARRQEITDSVSKKAEEYMQAKYNRAFYVKKTEFADGEDRKDDLLLTFNGSVHAYYDTDKDMFYDDRQSETINAELLRDIWLPMIYDLDVPTEGIGDWSQTFNVVYTKTSGSKVTRYSMYHEYYSSTAKHYATQNRLSVVSDNLILVIDQAKKCRPLYEKLSQTVTRYFKDKDNNDVNFYAVTQELHDRKGFSVEDVDETMDGCLARMHFGGEANYCSAHRWAKVTDGLYVMICCKGNVTLNDGDISLVPVEDYETVSKSILTNMDEKEKSAVDKYVTKKRSIDFENTIYKLEISNKVNHRNWKNVTFAFVMKDSADPITEYASINEKSHSFFAYDMNGSEYNATCLCSPVSRSVMFSYSLDSEVYFWFGSQS